MKRKTKSILAWGALDWRGDLCPGWLYPTKSLCQLDCMGHGFKPVRVRVSVYKKRKKKS